MSYLNPNTIPIPAQDSTDNNYIQDVIGNKTDTEAGNSLYSLIEATAEHVHSPSEVYPTLANGVTVAAAVGAWTLGLFVQVVPVNTITSPFDIHYIGVESIGANDVYELVLYKGLLSVEIEVGRVRFTRTTNLSAVINQPFQTPIIAANERISARIASAAGGANAATISIFYHTY